MSRYLASALGAKPSEFSRIIAELENLSGNPSEDVRLSSELVRASRQKIASLGLDPSDTTAQELYETLNTHFATTQRAYLRSIGEQPSSETIADLLSHFETQGVWTPKPSFIKKALIDNPPKKLMKALHYRTAESMMKRENPAKLAAAAGVCESSSWRHAFEKQINKVASSDWQIGPISILLFQNSPWSELPGKKSVQISCVAGSVILRPNLLADSDTLCLALRLIQAIETLGGQSRSATLRLLGEPHRYEVHTSNQMPQIRVGGLRLSLSGYEANSDDMAGDADAEVNDNKTSNPDLWKQFCRMHPALAWWKDSEALVFVNNAGEAVSLNLMDVAKNATGSLSYSHRKLENGRRRLEDKLAAKYASHQALDGIIAKPKVSASNFTSPKERLRQLQIRYGVAYAAGGAN